MSSLSVRVVRLVLGIVTASTALACAASTPVLAGKPSSSKAIQAARAWRDAMNTERSPAAVDAAVAKSGLPFWYVPRPPISDSDAVDTCGAAAAPLADAAALKPVIACVMDHGPLIDDAAYGPRSVTWKVIPASKIPAPMKAQDTQVAARARDHVLVLETLSIPAPATEWVLYLVGKGADGAIRVDGVLRAGRDDTGAQ